MESLEEIYSQTRAKQKGDETAFLEDKESRTKLPTSGNSVCRAYRISRDVC